MFLNLHTLDSEMVEDTSVPPPTLSPPTHLTL